MPNQKSIAVILSPDNEYTRQAFDLFSKRVSERSNYKVISIYETEEKIATNIIKFAYDKSIGRKDLD